METRESSDEATELGGSGLLRSGQTLALGQGETLGRYVVLSRLGAGGMGVVYAAYDPELDRKLAIKLLHDAGSEADGARRLLREAQAMAKLSHPNAVTVHDVGEHEGRVYVAMEFVAGVTLGQWRAQELRTREEILDVFLAAGRGLAAAHAVGLVHRDFKPDNVMVGDDGRVRVMDFGLARAHGASIHTGEEIPAPASNAILQSGELTRAGSIVGTPAYMAPEQHGGLDVGPAADQFAFCVALWEALYGQRPFGGSSLAELAAQVCAGSRRAPPPGASVPAWLRRVCERGLAVEPEQRFPDMNALLAALGRGRTRARGRVLAIATAAVGTTAAAIFGYEAYARARDTRACEAEGATIADVWNADRRAAVEAAILGSGTSYAEATAAKVVPWIEQHAAAWAHAKTQACMHASVDDSWTASTAERSASCLDERRMELEALVGELALEREEAVRGAVRAAAGLRPVDACLDTDPRGSSLQPPEESRAAVHAVRREVSRARALERLGAYEEGLAVVGVAVREAEAIDWAPLVAEAKLVEGSLLENAGRFAEAEAQLEEAYFIAAEARSTEVAFDAAAALAYTIGYRRGRADDAKLWSRHAEVLYTSLADPLHLHEIAKLGRVALVHYEAGEYLEARALNERMLELQQEVFGPEHPDVVSGLNNLAQVCEAMGEHAQALELMKRVLASHEANVGPDHPDFGMALSNIGNIHRAMRSYEEARAAYERSLAVREKALGPDHPDTAATLDNLGIVLRTLGEVDAARRMHERALAIFEAKLGPEHPSTAIALGNLGAIAETVGDRAQALVFAERAQAIREKALPPDHPHLAVGLDKLGTLHRSMGSYEAAWAAHERALAIWEKTLGPEHPHAAYSLVGLAATALAMERPAEAVPLVERAVQLRSNGTVDGPLLAEARFILANALAASGERGPRARELAEQARDAWRMAGPAKAQEVAAAEAWLEEHATAEPSG